MNNYSNNILQAIDTVVAQRLNELRFDNTIVCEIVKVNNEQKTEYIVSTGSNAFTAYGDRPYVIGQKVYVTIPQNDYSLKKIIIGSYSAENTTPYQYTHPFERIVDMTGNMFAAEQKILRIAPSATAATSVQTNTWTIDIPQHPIGEYKYIGLRVTFDTALPNTMLGNYGIRLALLDSENDKIDYFEYDSSELYGNPYYYDTGFTFEKIVEMPQGVRYSTGQLELYQKGNFDGIAPETKDIIAYDFYICFGYDQSAFTTDSFTIGLSQGQKLAHDKSKEVKNIKASLVHFNEETKHYEESDPLKYDLSWYRYRAGTPDLGGGSHWEKLFKMTDFAREWIKEGEEDNKSKPSKLSQVKKVTSALKEYFGEDEIIDLEEKVLNVELGPSNAYDGCAFVYNPANSESNGETITTTPAHLQVQELNDSYYTQIYKLEINNEDDLLKYFEKKNDEQYTFSLKINQEAQEPQTLLDTNLYLCIKNSAITNKGSSIKDGQINGTFKLEGYEVLAEKQANLFYPSEFTIDINKEIIPTAYYLVINYQALESLNFNFSILPIGAEDIVEVLQQYNTFFETSYSLKNLTSFPRLEDIYIEMEQPLGNPFNELTVLGKTSEGYYRETEFPSITYSIDKIKATITPDENKTIESNVLEFVLEGEKVFEQSDDVNSMINLSLEDQGYYPYYKENFALADYDNPVKTITASFADYTPWSNVTKIVWQVPKLFPLIINDPSNTIKYQEDEVSNADFILYSLTGTDISNTLKYKLKERIEQTSVDGYIYCYVYTNGKTEASSKVRMTFGKSGSGGTRFLLDIVDENNNRPWKYLLYDLTKGANQEVKKLRAKILDTTTNTYLELSEEEENKIKWEWLYDFTRDYFSRDIEGFFNDKLDAWSSNEQIEYSTQIKSNITEPEPIKTFSCTSLGDFNIAILKITYSGFSLENEDKIDLVEYFPIPVVAMSKQDDEVKSMLDEGMVGQTEFIYDISGKLLPCSNEPYGFKNANLVLNYGTMNCEENSSLVPQIVPVESTDEFIDFNVLINFNDDNREIKTKILSNILVAKDLKVPLNGEEETNDYNYVLEDIKAMPYTFDYNGDTKVDERDLDILNQYRARTNTEMSFANFLAEKGIKITKPLQSFYLSPANYYKNEQSMPWVTLYLLGKYNDVKVMWQQPIIIRSNTYGTDLLNNWDGKLLLDEESNSIFASMLVAGEKNRLNQFTGVVIGDVQKAYETEDLDGYGVYGFKNGKRSFSLDENGDAYLAGTIEAAAGKFGPFSIGYEGFITTNNEEQESLFTLSPDGTMTSSNAIISNANISTNNLSVSMDTVISSTEGGVEPVTLNRLILTSNTKTTTRLFAQADNSSPTRLRKTSQGSETWCHQIYKINSNESFSITFADSDSRVGWYVSYCICNTTFENLGFNNFNSWPADNAYKDCGMVTPWYNGLYKNTVNIPANYKGYYLIRQTKSNTSDESEKGGTYIGYKDTTINVIKGHQFLLEPSGKLTVVGGTFTNCTNTESQMVNSDRNLKHEINPLNPAYLNLLKTIEPVSYKYNDGTSNRTHTGFIAQQIEDSMKDSELTSQDFAALVINKETGKYALRYEEFIALNTLAIQDLYKTIEHLQSRIVELEDKLKEKDA